MPLWHGAIGRQEHRWIPAHCVVMESVMADSDCLGLRFLMVLPRGTAGVETFKVQAESPATPAEHASKHVMAVVWAARSGQSGQ